jgi:hypothetical protein
MEGPISPPTSPAKDATESGRNLIVIDWDDTILPTTQLTDHYGDYITGGAPLPAHVSEQLAALEDTAVAFLDEIASCGDATVITNAMNGTGRCVLLWWLRWFLQAHMQAGSTFQAVSS